jgi:hypothetical protein
MTRKDRRGGGRTRVNTGTAASRVDSAESDQPDSVQPQEQTIGPSRKNTSPLELQQTSWFEQDCI